MLRLFRQTRSHRGFPATLAVTAAVATLLLSGCSTSGVSSSDGSAHGDLAIQLSWVKTSEFAGEYFAVDRGYFSAAGFGKVNLVAGPAATAAVVASGQVLVGISDPTRVAPAILNEKAPIKIIANLYQKNPFTILSLADKANIRTPQDLIGKRIGIQTGNEPLFYALLDANRIPRDKVTIVPVEYDPSPLTTGDVDGFLAYITNESVILKSKGYSVQNLLYADNGLELVAKSVVVSQNSIDNRREALKAYLWATLRGWNDAVSDPEEGARLAVAKYGADLGLSPDIELKQAVAANGLIQSPDTKKNGLMTTSQDLIRRNIDILKSIGLNISADQLFDMSLIEEVYKEHPEVLK